MKAFKKTLSVFLAALMAFSCFALCAGAVDEKPDNALKVAVASDIHTNGAETISDINGDGRVNTSDVGKINSHAKGTNKLW